MAIGEQSNKFEEIVEGDIIEGVDGPVDRWAIQRYAETSGDHNPIHTTYSVAMAAGLGGVIQHGLFSMAWLIKALTTWFQERGRLKQINVQFRAMVRPGDIVYSKGKVLKKHQEKGQKLVDLELTQEAWSLLCKGTGQAMDQTIDTKTFKELLSNMTLKMDLETTISGGKIKEIPKREISLNADAIEIIPKTLSFWEAFTQGWCAEGDTIQVKLEKPPEDGKAEFEIYRVSNSIVGTATVSLK